MQQGDYSSSYYQQYPHHHLPHLQNPNPNPNSTDLQPPSLSPSTYASAPPFASNYSPDYPNFPSGYPPYTQNPDPVPNLSPTAPSYAPNPNFQSFNPSSFPSFPPVQEQQAPYAPPPPTTQQPPYYPPYDQHQTTPNYTSPTPIPSNTTPNTHSNPNSSFPPSYSSYGHHSSTVPPVFDNNSYESSLKFDKRSYLEENPGRYGGESNLKFDNRGGYLDENPGRYGGQSVYGRSRSDLGPDYYERRPDGGYRYEDGVGQDVYPYTGGKTEPYGARGTGAKSSTWAAPSFDDYGRSINLGSSGKDQLGSPKVVKAVPKVETQQDVKNGVQKFRVKLLAESGGQSPMDVLCQIGLDGIRMLDPSTGRMLRIYPLENVTRSEVTDSSIFTFWSKSSVDIEPRRIRLQSNSYTTNTILDTVTAATFQLKEMGRDSFRSKASDPGKVAEQLNEKKKGLADWVNLIKPGNEEKDHWVPDEAVTKCAACGTDFGAFLRKHHCRNCGDIFCDKCTHGRIALTADENAQPVRVCDRCMAEVTQRLSSAKESASKPASLCSHEDLAKKLQEEMERNRKASSGTKSFSDGSGRRMREVACPTCTVHLQVQVPSSGSETIECGVCQHPFLVSAH